MQTAMQKIGDSYLLVTPDGKPVPHKDAEQPTFHILPQIYSPDSSIGLKDITLLGVEVLFKSQDGGYHGVNVMPDHVKLTHPYPNASYTVAGTSERKMGWDIPLDISNPPQQIRMRWAIKRFIQTIQILNHYVELEFELTKMGNVFSMHSHSLHSSSSEGAMPIGFTNPNDAKDCFTREDETYQIGYDQDELVIYQSNKIRSCAWSDLGLEEFENMVHLRDMTPVTTFKTYLEEFASDACIEMPAPILKEAISRAKAIAESQEEFWFGEKQYEHCPGLQHICQWWNDNAPNPDYRRAVNVYLWVRVEDDSEYWAGWYECPNLEIGVLNPDRCARVGQHVIIEFLQGHGAYTPINNYGFMVWGVDGKPFWDVGGPIEDADEAYYGHGMLKGFPERFPVAFQALA